MDQIFRVVANCLVAFMITGGSSVYAQELLVREPLPDAAGNCTICELGEGCGSCRVTTPRGLSLEVNFERLSEPGDVRVHVEGHILDVSLFSDLNTGEPRPVEIEVLDVASDIEVLQIADPYPGNQGESFTCAVMIPVEAEYAHGALLVFTGNSFRSVQCNGTARYPQTR